MGSNDVSEALVVVFDTNVLVSAEGYAGTPLECWLLARTDPRISIATSEGAIAELARVLEYDRLPISNARREELLREYRRVAILVEPSERLRVVQDDPDDDVFIECAVEADADYIVSGDSHLTDLGSVRGIEILAPAAFIDRLDEDA